MSDDKPETAEVPATPKTYSEEEFKKVVAERDKAKAKNRETEEKEKKAAEEKAIEEGRLKEVLAQKESLLADAHKKLEAVETARQVSRQRVLDGITDPNVKRFAEKMGDESDIRDFLETLSKTKLETHKALSEKGEPQKPAFKSARDFINAGGGGGLRP